MRKLLVFILLAAFLLTTPVLAAGEPDSRSTDPSTCAHHFEVSVVREATCTQKGLLAYTCSKCGLTYTAETMPDGAHDYVLTDTTATCTEDGENTYTCSACGDSYTEPAPATGHVAPDGPVDCTEPTVCTVCGQVIAPATGHEYVYQFDAEQAEDGSFLSYGTWQCSRCGDVMAATAGNAAYYYGTESTSQTEAETEDDLSQRETEAALPLEETEDALSETETEAALPASEDVLQETEAAAPAEPDGKAAAEGSGTDLLMSEEVQYEDDSPTSTAEEADDGLGDSLLWIIVSVVALALIVVETVLLIRPLKKNKTTL